MKKITTLMIATLALAMLLGACAQREPANQLEAIRQKGKMVAGTSADYPPFEYVDASDQLVGFDIDLMKEIGKRMGVEMEIVDMPFDSLITAVREGKIDISVAAFSYTEERDETVDFTDAYYSAEDGFLVREDFAGSITQPEGAANYIVGVQRGATADSWATENLVNAGLMPERNLLRYARMDQAAQDVKDGQIDILITDYVPALALAEQIGGLKVIYHAEISAGSVNIIVPEGSTELTAVLNEIIAAMHEDGFIDKLARKHIGP